MLVWAEDDADTHFLRMPRNVFSLELSSGAFSATAAEAGVAVREGSVELAGVVSTPEDEEAMMFWGVLMCDGGGGVRSVESQRGKGKKGKTAGPMGFWGEGGLGFP